jgi:plasmid stabilization system protein ParE
MSPKKRATGARRKRSTKAMAIVWTRRARQDLVAIGDYIARDNPVAAGRWVGSLILAVENAAANPLAGRIVPEIGREDLREVLRGNYRIVYRVEDTTLQILTVFEGHRLLRPGDLESDE